jgi:exodeoxyribonuclease V beta subunit
LTFSVLNPNQDILGKKVLEASAGSGKTFAIEHIVVRLLLNDNPISIDQILVVTFTNAATKELKFRIRSNIEKAIRYLKGMDNENNHFEYLNSYVGNFNACSKLQDALDLFEISQIFTIHGFCFRILKEFAIDSDVIIDLKQNDHVQELMKDTITDYLKYKINPNDFSSEQIEVLLNDCRGLDNFCLKLIDSIDDVFEVDDNNRFISLYNKFNSKLKELDKIDEKSAIEIFEQVAKDYKKKTNIKKSSYVDQVKCLVSIVHEENCSIDQFKFLLKTKFSLFDFLDEGNKKVKSQSAVLHLFYQKVKEILYPIIKQALDPKILFFTITKEISKEINDMLDEKEILSFDRILLKTAKAITNQKLKEKIQNRYKAAIIDEFQDTDDIQFEIFENLFLNNTSIDAFYLIGDPKQSIYSFRKANLYTYIKATERIGNINYLDTNYRSTKALVDALNELFSENFSKNWLKLPQINKSLNYSPVKTGKAADFKFSDELAAIHFFIAEDECKTKKWPSASIEEKYFSFITKEIIKLKNQHGFADNGFAVLVKDRYQAERLKNYFEKYYINSSTARASSLKDSHALNSLIDFFSAVLNPQDINLIKIACKGPFILFDDQRIIDLETDIDIFNQFNQLKKDLQKGLGFFFSQFFISQWNGFTVLENIASKKDVSFYHDVIEIIEKMLSEENLTINKISSYFNGLLKLPEDDERLKSNQNHGLGVNILTTFMSKGLEYEIVFALGLASRTYQSSDFANHIETDAEKMRQFYVALTRAKYRVYVPLALDIKESSIKEGQFSCTEYFFNHILGSANIIKKQDILDKLNFLQEKGHVSYEFIQKASIEKVLKQENEVILQPPKILQKNYLSSSIFSFSSLKCEEEKQPFNKKNSLNLPAGANIGIVFHDILEKIILSADYENKNIKKIIKGSLEFTEFETYEESFSKIIFKAFQIPLIEEDSFCLKDVPVRNVKPEIEFMFSFPENYIKGFIDLVFEYRGKYYIIDWKSNYLGETSHDYKTINLEAQMQKHDYFLQAAIYTKSLERYLKIKNIDFDKHFGGVFYIFLRGFLFEEKCGIYHFFPDFNLLNNLDQKKLIC